MNIRYTDLELKYIEERDPSAYILYYCFYSSKPGNFLNKRDNAGKLQVKLRGTDIVSYSQACLTTMFSSLFLNCFLWTLDHEHKVYSWYPALIEWFKEAWSCSLRLHYDMNIRPVHDLVAPIGIHKQAYNSSFRFHYIIIISMLKPL